MIFFFLSRSVHASQAILLPLNCIWALEKPQYLGCYLWNAADELVNPHLWMDCQNPEAKFLFSLLFKILKIHDRLFCFFLLKVPEKKVVLKKDQPVSLKSEEPPESTQGSKEKSSWKAETPQVRALLEGVQLSPHRAQIVLWRRPGHPKFLVKEGMAASTCLSLYPFPYFPPHLRNPWLCI